jgi:hypothetical protein
MSLPRSLKRAPAAALCILIAGLIALLASNESALGGQKKNPGKAAVKVADLQIVQALGETRKLLEAANHDYQGHRAAAVHQVMHAVHLLQHHKHHPNPANLTAALSKQTVPGNKEAQAASDAQLRQAITNLQVIGPQIQSISSGPHHQHAVQAVNKAITELQTALQIK